MRHRSHTAQRTLALAGVLALLVAACGESVGDGTEDEADGDGTEDEADGDASEDEPGDERADWPDPFVYGLLPTEDAETMLTAWAPLEEYMADCLDHPFELFTGTNYTAMIEAMRTGNIHVATFGPFSYILAHERAGAEAFVQAVAAPDAATYRSIIITLESHGFNSLEDLEGESLAFVDPASTSGHLFPRALMVESLGIDNDDVEDWFGDVVFSGGHDASLLSVLNEDVDAAAVSSNTWINLVEGGEFDDHPNIEDLTVLTETQDIPRTLIAISGDVPQDLGEAAESCFLGAIDEPTLDGFFEGINAAAGFVTVTDDAYDVVRDTSGALGMSPEDLLE